MNYLYDIFNLKHTVSNNVYLQDLVDGCGSSGIKKLTCLEFQLIVQDCCKEVENLADIIPQTKHKESSHGNPSLPILSCPPEAVAVVAQETTTTTEPATPSSCLGKPEQAKNTAPAAKRQGPKEKVQKYIKRALL